MPACYIWVHACMCMCLFFQKRFVHFWRSFSIKTNENVFWKNTHLHMHASTQISHAGNFFDADSEFKVRFPRLWLLLFLGIKSESNQVSLKKRTQQSSCIWSEWYFFYCIIYRWNWINFGALDYPNLNNFCEICVKVNILSVAQNLEFFESWFFSLPRKLINRGLRRFDNWPWISCWWISNLARSLNLR